MTRFISLATAAFILLLLGVVSANARTWTSTWSGPYGGSRTVTGHCGYYGCQYYAQGVGPGGQPWSSAGAIAYGPYHTYSYRAVTGPGGNTYVVRRVWRRW
jgi:hypothetical protein